MDKNAIFNYVEYAREELQKLIKQKAFEYGITDKGAQRGLNVINGRLLSREELSERDTLLTTIESKEDGKGFANGYEIVMEEVSYTWFNRFIALRFMEVNGYLPSHTRVFSDENGRFNPQILKEALTLDIYGIDRLKVSEMVQNNQNEELFKYLIILQCNALSKPMPRMFERIENYTELLFPNGLLKKGSIIDRLVSDIDEEDWKDQVQIIGWMYQFYISKKKDEVFASKKTITKNTIGAVTQLFTPDWIVRYMAENSIGRIWLESNPDSPLKSEMKYYVEDAKQEEDVQKKLEEIRYKDVNPEEIKIIEPCCGSGHILVYCFDLLYKMYLEKGYSQRDIATLILKNNLYGLDVDNRAAQLAYFSVMMKARSVDKQYLTRDTVQQAKVYEIIDSQQLINHNYESLLKETRFSEKSIGIARYLVSTYKNGKVIGSLLKVNRYDYKELIDEIKEKQISFVPNLTIMDDWNICLPQLRQLAVLAIVMSRKYDVMITNPPYLGSSSLEEACKEYVAKEYPNSKTDMFSMFMETQFIKNGGLLAMINQHQWMFTSSYVEFRKSLQNKNTLINAIHLGTRAFEEISGEKVQSVTFVMKTLKINDYNSCYIRLTSVKNAQQKEIEFIRNKNHKNNNIYTSKINRFNKIDGSPYAYWISDNVSKTFLNKTLENYSYIGKGLDTCDQDKFERLWFEVDYSKLSLNGYDDNKKWFLFSKGGGYRRWYGNLLDVVDWSNNGHSIRNLRTPNGKIKSRPQNIDKYFKKCVTWSSVGTGAFGARIIEKSIFGNGSAMFAFDESYNLPFMALLNSNIVDLYLSFLSPTLTFNAGDLMRIPVFDDIINNESIISLVKENIEVSKVDWSENECSWEFKNNLLTHEKGLIKDIFESFEKNKKNMFQTVKANEERINELLITIYGLNDELNCCVDERNICISLANNDCIKDLISYAIGVSFGRYSLDVEGLAYAGGDWNPELYSTIIPDDNNIIPILDDGYYSDDAMNKLIEFLTKVYGEDVLDENLKFIADALGGTGTSKEAIREYFINDFYSYHLFKYKTKNSGSRPIYWLFDAGKQNSFKALIYMHRYTPDLLAKMRTDYILPLMDKYSSRIAYLEKEIPTLTGTLATKSRKELDKVRAQLKELSEYEPKIHHLADERISIDLDDGVKHNYELFKDVLAPLK